jgi:hypothetical protein
LDSPNQKNIFYNCVITKKFKELLKSCAARFNVSTSSLWDLLIHLRLLSIVKIKKEGGKRGERERKERIS